MIPAISGFKRPLPGPAEEPEAKRRRVEKPTLFERMSSGAPLSLIDRISARELGLIRKPITLQDYFEQGKRLLKKGKEKEAEEVFDHVRLLFASNNPSARNIFVEMASREYEAGLFEQAIATSEKILSEKSSYILAHLFISLCYLQMGMVNEFENSFESFHRKWVNGTILAPQSELSSVKHHYLKMMKWAIHEVHQVIRIIEGGRFDFRYYLTLVWLYLACNDDQNAYGAAVKLQEADEEHSFAWIVKNLCLLKIGTPESKEEAVVFFETDPELEIEDDYRMKAIWKSILDEGLKNDNPRLLKAALSAFQIYIATHPTDHFSLCYIFYAQFALEHYEEAFEIAQRIETAHPGTGLLQKNLCRLSQAAAADQNILEDLQKILQAKAYCDGVFLNFIGKYLARRSAELSAPLPADAFFGWAALFKI
jgi:tetratricopeptide (TPR) repeat protein